MDEGRLLQVDRLIEVSPGQIMALVEPAQLDLPFLAAGQASSPRLPANQLVLVVDGNRANFEPTQWMQHHTMVAVPVGDRARLQELTWDRSVPVRQHRFGAMWIFVLQRRPTHDESRAGTFAAISARRGVRTIGSPASVS